MQTAVSPAPDNHGKIIELRALLARKHPAPVPSPPPSRLATGLPGLDGLLEGGLPKAALTEVIRPPHGAGSATMIQALVEAAQAAGQRLALVDAGDFFDPDALSNAQLSALLWVRCKETEQAVKAADLLCRDNNLPLIVLDLMMCPERQVRAIPATSWYRLQRVVEENGPALLVVTAVPVVGSAACTLRLTGRFPLSALNLLRAQLVARLQVEIVRARAWSRSGHETTPAWQALAG